MCSAPEVRHTLHTYRTGCGDDDDDDCVMSSCCCTTGQCRVIRMNTLRPGLWGDPVESFTNICVIRMPRSLPPSFPPRPELTAERCSRL
jgi:hypothetical protein